jgi:hypothetical protein
LGIKFTDDEVNQINSAAQMVETINTR